MNLEVYSPKLRLKSTSTFTGTIERDVEAGDAILPWHNALVQAFLADDDLQEMTIVSTNIGFVKTLTKQYAKAIGADA